MIGPAVEVLRSVEADDLAGSGSSGTSGALTGGCLADAVDVQDGDAGPGRVGGNAREAAVDDGAHAFDGDGTLGEIGGEDQLGLLAGGDGAVLFGGGEIAMERSDGVVAAARDGIACGGGATDLGRTGEEGEDIAGARRGARTRKRPAASRGAGEYGVWVMTRSWRRPSERMTGQSSRKREMDAVSMVADMMTMRRSGRAVRLQATEKGEGEVGVEVAFVEFVENDGAGVAECGVGKKAAGEDAFGEEAETGFGSGDFLEAHLVANGLAGTLAHFFGDAAGSHAGGDAPGFQDENFAAEREQGGWDARGLSRPGRGFDDEVGGLTEGGEDSREEFVNGERLEQLSFYEVRLRKRVSRRLTPINAD